MQTDPIADMLSRIRNGYLARKSEVLVPYSALLAKIAEILVRDGYLEKTEVEGKGKRQLKLQLKYLDGRPAATKLLRVSKPGRRIYQGFKKLPRVIGGLGLAIVSTSKGVMTAEDAKKIGLGGEVICQVW